MSTAERFSFPAAFRALRNGTPGVITDSTLIDVILDELKLPDNSKLHEARLSPQQIRRISLVAIKLVLNYPDRTKPLPAPPPIQDRSL